MVALRMPLRELVEMFHITCVHVRIEYARIDVRRHGEPDLHSFRLKMIVVRVVSFEGDGSDLAMFIICFYMGSRDQGIVPVVCLTFARHFGKGFRIMHGGVADQLRKGHLVHFSVHNSSGVKFHFERIVYEWLRLVIEFHN